MITVERHDLRNRNTTKIVRNAPSNSDFWTSHTDSATRTPESRTTSSRVPGYLADSSARSCFSFALTLALTSVVL